MHTQLVRVMAAVKVTTEKLGVQSHGPEDASAPGRALRGEARPSLTRHVRTHVRTHRRLHTRSQHLSHGTTAPVGPAPPPVPTCLCAHMHTCVHAHMGTQPQPFNPSLLLWAFFLLFPVVSSPPQLYGVRPYRYS